MRTRIVAVRLLVGPDAELADVRVHRAAGQGKLHIRAGAPRTTLLPLWQFETGQIRHEVGFPLVAPRFDGAELALTPEVAVFADALLERVLVLKDEVRTVEQVHDDGQVRDRGETRGLAAGAV